MNEFRDKWNSIVTLKIQISNFYSIYTTRDYQHREPSLDTPSRPLHHLLFKKSNDKIIRCDAENWNFFFLKKPSRRLKDLCVFCKTMNLRCFIRVSCNDVPNSEYSENVNATIETRVNNWVQFVRVVRWWCWPLRRVGCARNFARSWINIFFKAMRE